MKSNNKFLMHRDCPVCKKLGKSKVSHIDEPLWKKTFIELVFRDHEGEELKKIIFCSLRCLKDYSIKLEESMRDTSLPEIFRGEQGEGL